MEAGNKPTRAGAPAPAPPASAPAPPPTPASGGSPASVQVPSSVQGHNATATHGQGPRAMPVPARRPDAGGLDPQRPQAQIPDQPSREPPRKKRPRIDNGGAAAAAADDSDDERQEAMDMVDRANAGQPVLSGPADLGLDESGWEEQKPQKQQGATTGKTAHDGSGQLQKSSGQVQKSPLVSEGANLWGTSTWDPDDETNMYWEHGRRYARDYFMPNDEDEQDRLRILHQIYLNIFNLELTTIPLQDPTAVLDVGTGTGEWAMGTAERWPDCEVTGVDISPTFERAVPLNCHFEVHDGEDPWKWEDGTFDMVHYRHMSGAFRDWNVVYSETLRCLKPGGWVEILEFHDHEGEKNFYNRFPPHSLMHKAAKDIERAEVLHGKHRGIDHMEPELLENNGFVDCEVHEHIIPLDPSNSPLGKLWLVTLRAGFESYALRLLTKYMNWDAASVRVACESVGQQMIAMATNPALNKGFQIRLRVTIARKPLRPKAEPTTPGQSAITAPDYKHSDTAHAPSPAPASSSSSASPFPAVPGTQYAFPNPAAQPRPPV